MTKNITLADGTVKTVNYITSNAACVLLMRNDFRHGAHSSECKTTSRKAEHSFVTCTTYTLRDGSKVCFMKIYFEVDISSVAIREIAFTSVDDANDFYLLWRHHMSTYEDFTQLWKKLA